MKFLAGLVALITFITYVSSAVSGQAGPLSEEIDIHAGYYSREGNDSGPAKTTGHSIYIKFYLDGRVALLYLPFPYSTTVDAGVLNQVFDKIGTQITTKSYVRSTFDLLTENATAHVETFETRGRRAVFECDGTAPCVVEFTEDSMLMSKSGIIGDHIIKFNHIDASP